MPLILLQEDWGATNSSTGGLGCHYFFYRRTGVPLILIHVARGAANSLTRPRGASPTGGQ